MTTKKELDDIGSAWDLAKYRMEIAKEDLRKHCINEFVPLPRDFFGRQGMTTKRSGATLRRNDAVYRKKIRQGCGRIMQCFLNCGTKAT